MWRKHIYTLLLVSVALALTECQSVDEAPGEAPAETPGEVSLVAPLGEDKIEGSGDGPVELNEGLTTSTGPAPPLEEVDPSRTIAATASIVSACEVCTCSNEGEGDTYTVTVDCSGKELTAVPAAIDEKTTKLNLQNNKLEHLPQSIGSLKNLRILNANNNSIKELEFGSVSELPDLRILKLANNRLLEIPQDLKNSFGSTKLEELDLGGNDIREILTTETFSQFKGLKKLTLLEISDEVIDTLCGSPNNVFQEICKSESCTECPNAILNNPEDYAVHPNMLAIDENAMKNNDPAIDTPAIAENDTTLTTTDTADGKADTTTEFSLRNAVNKEGSVQKIEGNSRAGTGKQKEDIKAQDDVKVGATSASNESAGGGVSTLVIGLIVGGMVLVVSGVVIRKNWSSIRDRFSSTPRPATDRSGQQTNGTTPEEIPLQEKSPV